MKNNNDNLTQDESAYLAIPDITPQSDKQESEKLISSNSDFKFEKRNFGKTFPFYFKNNEPVIVIGPHCINN